MLEINYSEQKKYIYGVAWLLNNWIHHKLFISATALETLSPLILLPCNLCTTSSEFLVMQSSVWNPVLLTHLRVTTAFNLSYSLFWKLAPSNSVWYFEINRSHRGVMLNEYGRRFNTGWCALPRMPFMDEVELSDALYWWRNQDSACWIFRAKYDFLSIPINSAIAQILK